MPHNQPLAVNVGRWQQVKAMADLKFACPHCGQEIECDELWSGHQIQCPTCRKELTVPLKPEVSPLATFASAKPGQAKLSIGSSRAQRSASERTVAPQAVALEQQLAQAKAGQKGAALKWVKIGVGVLVVAVGGLVGYPYLRDWMVQRDAAAKSTSASTTQPPAATAEPAAPAETPVEKELPLLPPAWTLDVGQARIPESNANGVIAGSNFVVETARLDSMPGNIYLLRLVEGPLASPARAFMVYLRLNAGESILDRSWTISPDMKGKHVPQVVKLWKPNPRYQAQQKTFASGYVLKLEFGKTANGVIPGKIFLAVPPETEQSVVAGIFKANTNLAGVTDAPAEKPAEAAESAAEPLPTGATSFEQRYGGKR